MSASLSKTIADALVREAAKPGLQGRRLLLTELFGARPAEVFAELNGRLDRRVTVQTGKRSHTMGAVSTTNGAVLVPYLVDPEHPSANAGSGGFAATLRTQFLASAPEPRTLLILDERPVETVRSATEPARELLALEWPQLTDAALTAAAEAAGVLVSPFLRRVHGEFAAPDGAAPGRASFEWWVQWLDTHMRATEQTIGRDLWQLGCFVSDPAAAGGPVKRLRDGKKWRRRLDELFASGTKDFAGEVRKLLAKKGVPEDVIAKVGGATTAFEVQYARFTLDELVTEQALPTVLRTDPVEPIAGARAVLRGDGSVIIWAPTAPCGLQVQLERQPQADEGGTLRWSDGSELTLHAGGGASLRLDLPRAEGDRWAFGTLQLISLTSPGSTGPGESLDVGVYRADGPWFPVEDTLALDPAREAFLCETDPVAVAYADGGQRLGVASYPSSEDEPPQEHTLLQVSYSGDTATLPVLLLGEGPEEGPERPEGPDGPDGPEGPEDEPQEPDNPWQDEDRNGYPTVAHALLVKRRTGWPHTEMRRLDDDEETTKGPLRVHFNLGALRLTVAEQRPANVDGAALEQAILERPEWTSYLWSEATTALGRGRAPAVRAGQLDATLVEEFDRARAAFFTAARAAGSVYALDAASEDGKAYVAAYGALLDSVPREGRYASDWDALLLCDSVTLPGRDDLLFAPTSPLAVAFHAGLAATFASWVTASADVPGKRDVMSLSLRHSLPLVHAADSWYESAHCAAALWRHYVPLADDAPGLPGRNSDFIAQRLRYFLKVHPAYDNNEQVLSVAFVEPSDGDTVSRALRAFYRSERNREEYRLPKLDVAVVGGPEGLQRSLDGLMGGGQPDDLDRLVQSRVTLTGRPTGDLPGFAHLTFLFRSPGRRRPRQVDMTERWPTAHLGGLAAAPGRKVYEDADQVFSWGTWAPPESASDTYQALLTRGLELVGGQPGGKLTGGWTTMASATIDREQLDELYGKRSVWVVHLDRLIGIEAFPAGSRQLIEYEDRADPDEPGYDGITATEHVQPYLDALTRALESVPAAGGKLGIPGEGALARLLERLNAVSGRWAIELLQRGDKDILQKVGFVAGIAAIEQLEGCLGSRDEGTGVLVALDEVIPGAPRAGLRRLPVPRPRDREEMCDDLLLLWVPHGANGPVTVRGALVEAKFATTGRPDQDRAAGQLDRSRRWLHNVFNEQGSSRPFRARDLAELITNAAARANTFKLGTRAEGAAFEAALTRIAAGDYELDLRHWRDGQERAGVALSVEAESGVAASQGLLPAPGDAVDALRLGRPLLARLVAGQDVEAGNVWHPISFEPPSGEPARPQPATTGPRGDSPQTPPAPGQAPQPEPAAPAEPPIPAANAAGGWTAVATPDVDEDEVLRLAHELDGALEKYRLAVEPFRAELAQVGPNVIRFRTRPLGPLSVASIENKARDLGREVGAPGAVIVSQEPHYICIDVPRAGRRAVPYAEVAGVAAQHPEAGALDFILGVAPSGEVRTADLARLPHLLVAGATGSGKSVFLRGLLCHLVRTRGPARLRILLVDPKQLDFAGFAALPHLEGGRIITEPVEAMEVLQATIERELEARRPILVEAGATSATEFYERGGSYEQLPQMVVLVDEFADLAGVLEGQQRRGFHELIQRYAQLTRAFGIYLVLATQRPSVDVITGSIKANLTARVALSLPSHRDSMTVLDRPGAEDLLGQGDLLFYFNGQVERLQGVFAGPPDVAHAVERWRGVENPGAA